MADLVPMSEIQENRTPKPTSKYDVERSGYTSLAEIRAEKEAQAIKDGNYNNMFEDAYDKIKADSNNDGKIDNEEYKSYIVSSHEKNASSTQINRVEDTNIKHNYYHFDSTLLIVIGMVCLTAIIVTWIKKK